jgi:hypothetical protein
MSEQRDWNDEGSGGLFSRRATDNAEVVTEGTSSEGLWSTERRDEDDAGDPGVGPVEDPPPSWWTQPASAAPEEMGGVFSAEPVERDRDVLDVPEPDADEPWDVAPPSGPPLFAQRGEPVPDHTAGGDSLWRDLDVDDDLLVGEPDEVGRATLRDVGDPNAFERAVARLDVAERERASVALAVCGALLDEDETVLGVVTGQMLGRPAAVTVTRSRVLIANDRRWQPLVDRYAIAPGLSVRGRHDRDVAALSFSDGERMSMVDGITDVELAIELAELIRNGVAGR